MNAVIKRTSFAPGNYVNASAFANTDKDFPEFIATSRLIDRVKTGINKTEAVLITAIDRPASKTRAKSSPARELHMSIPANGETGIFLLKSRDDVSASFIDADNTIYEAVSGKIEVESAAGENIKGKFNIDLELPGTEGKTFILKGEFQVLKAG
ncbi:hypothetical protein ACCC96_27300 [Pseudomonas sp. Pseusp11]|uniref:hypothetical protein n=1 Tax=Pseudomonas sp. Pseusp11 TaxID=3243003 RepID=UPI0039B6E92D